MRTPDFPVPRPWGKTGWTLTIARYFACACYPIWGGRTITQSINALFPLIFLCWVLFNENIIFYFSRLCFSREFHLSFVSVYFYLDLPLLQNDTQAVRQCDNATSGRAVSLFLETSHDGRKKANRGGGGTGRTMSPVSPVWQSESQWDHDSSPRLICLRSASFLQASPR